MRTCKVVACVHQLRYCEGMPNQTAWSRYIADTHGDDTNTAIALRVGVDKSTIGRWRTGASSATPGQVVAYARAYKRSPMEALIAAGYLAPEELDMTITNPTLTVADFSALALSKELTRRLSQDTPASDMFPFTTDTGDGQPHNTLFSS